MHSCERFLHLGSKSGLAFGGFSAESRKGDESPEELVWEEFFDGSSVCMVEKRSAKRMELGGWLRKGFSLLKRKFFFRSKKKNGIRTENICEQANQVGKNVYMEILIKNVVCCFFGFFPIKKKM